MQCLYNTICALQAFKPRSRLIMENKKKILIYDTSKGFSRFIKLNFSDRYDVTLFFDYKDFRDIRFEEYSAGFFIINESIEAFDLMLIYSKLKSLIVGSRVPIISKNLNNVDDITIIDLTKSRQEMVEFIDFNLKIFAVAE